MDPSAVEACCRLEARAFNELRRLWGQPEQAARRPECLAEYARRYPQGAKVARAGEHVIGYCLSHRWGSLGWIGPVVVEPERQGHGLGRALTEPVVEALQSDGCTSIVLETWPHHLPNIRFYMRLGFYPLAPVFLLAKPARASGRSPAGTWFGALADRRAAMDGLRNLSDSVSSGTDYRPAAEVALACRVGDAVVWGDLDRPWAGAVVHTASQLQEPAPDWLEVFLLIIRPGLESRLGDCLAELQDRAAGLGRRAVRLAVCACHAAGLLDLVRDRGFEIVKSRLRLALAHVAVPPATVDYVSFGI